MKWSIEPPPSLTGDDKKDIQNIFEYVTSLHNYLNNTMNSNLSYENLNDEIKNKLSEIDSKVTIY